MTNADDGFLARWAKRKAQVRSGVDTPPEAPVRAVPDVALRSLPPAAPLAGAVATAPAQVAAREPVQAPARTPASAPELPALPTMEDVALLTRSSDFSSFVQPGIDPGVSNAAMKKLFSDPRYNVMDGLDTYIGDYNTPDPIPLSMLRQMNQAKFLGLFDDEGEDENKNGDDKNDKPAAEIAAAAVTRAEAPTAAATRLPAQQETETDAPADAPESRPDDDTDL